MTDEMVVPTAIQQEREDEEGLTVRHVSRIIDEPLPRFPQPKSTTVTTPTEAHNQ